MRAPEHGVLNQPLQFATTRSYFDGTAVTAGYPKARELMEKIMNAKINLPSMMIGVTACTLGVALVAYDAAAQTAKDLVGTWTPVSITAVQDGKTIEPYGPNPKALLFDDKGRYVSLIVRSDLPKFASDNRMTGTPEENKAVVQGTNAHLSQWRRDFRPVRRRKTRPRQAIAGKVCDQRFSRLCGRMSPQLGGGSAASSAVARVRVAWFSTAPAARARRPFECVRR